MPTLSLQAADTNGSDSSSSSDTDVAADPYAGNIFNNPRKRQSIVRALNSADAEFVEKQPSIANSPLVEGDPADGQELGPRNFCQCMVEQLWFHGCVNVMTALNTVQMGLEADHPDWETAWRVCELIFTTCFFLEMAIKIVAMKKRYFLDRANWLDGSLAVIGVIDCYILASLPGGNDGLHSLSALRILRLVRLARILKLVRGFKPFVLMIRGVLHSIATMSYIAILLLIIIYVFALFFTEQFRKDTELYPGYSTVSEVIDEQELMMNYNPYICFGTMKNSMLTLFNIAIMAEWTEIVRPIALKQPAYLLVFLFFALIVAFCVMNVMIGMIVDGVMAESKQLGSHPRAQDENAFLLDQIQRVLTEMNSNGDANLEVDELAKFMQNHPLFDRVLEVVDLPADFNADELIALLDFQGNGAVQKAEFARNLYRLMKSDEFQQMCILQSNLNQVKNLIKNETTYVKSKLSGMEAELCLLKKAVCPVSASETHAARARSCSAESTRREPRSESCEEQCRHALKEQDHGALSAAVKDQGDGLSSAEDKLAGCIDAVCNGLMESIERTSHKKLVEVLDAAYLAMKESFQMELAQMKPDIEARMCFQRGHPDSAVNHSPLDGGPHLSGAQDPRHTAEECMSNCDDFQSVVSVARADLPDRTTDQHTASCATDLYTGSHDYRFEEGTGQLGFEVHWLPGELPFVGGVRPGSTAHVHGMLPGDRLIECNEISVAGKSREEVLHLLQARPVLLRVFRGSDIS